MSVPEAVKILNKINSLKLKENVLEIPSMAKRESWSLSYDKLADSLYFTPKKIPADYILFNINNELAIYVNNKSEIKGIFIENYSANFVKHNVGFAQLLKILSTKVDDDIYVSGDKNKSAFYEKALEGSLLEAIGNQREMLPSAKFLVSGRHQISKRK